MRRLLPIVSLLAVLAVPSVASAADPVPFGHACTAQDGVRFCPTTDIQHNVPSFDGSPLDVDVTLPASGAGSFPTIVMLHGYGQSKRAYESTTPDPVGPSVTYHYNTNFFAKQGYAVVTYSARGFGHSCGKSDPLLPGSYPGSPFVLDCTKGFSHLADQRFEVRDTQYLLGVLVDAGIAKADALAATGISYGGGQSLQLALLRDRVRNLDGGFSPWTSPKGTALHLAAAWPRWPWTDLTRSLLPNGRWRDYGKSNGGQSRTPIGVELQSYQNGLFAIRGTDAPVGDPTADLRSWKALADKGEPYDAKAAAPLQELSTFHSGAGLLDLGAAGFTAAPLLLEGGFTDELFPAPETLDAYNRLRKLKSTANVALQLGDLGHSKGANKVDPDKFLNDQGAAFFAANLLGTKSASTPAIGSVTAYTQTCPKAKASKRYSGKSWKALHPGALRFGDAKEQLVDSKGGDAKLAADLDPLKTTDPCVTFAVTEAKNTADYVLEAKRAFTMLGLPTIRASIKTDGKGGQLDARLWDVDGKKQTLITRGVYRLKDNQKGRITFQLHGNAYKVAKGHLVRLELLGRDSPYYRASNTKFTVAVTKLQAELPTREGASKKTGVSRPKLGR